MGKLASGQVINDNIEHRIHLQIEKTYTSNTVNSTVQWDCVNTALTRKCIQYHNDQWFEFQVPFSDTYYVNISNQRCRDLYGVQIAVIDGIPCETRSYQIVTCYSTGTQDDIFLTLTGLDPLKTYLINIDGYLHDFCSFEITLSKTPKGLPVETASEVEVYKTYKQDSVVLEWDIPKEYSGAIHEFEIWKRNHKASRHALFKSIPVERNALGTSPARYVFRDQRIPGQAVSYKIVGMIADKTILVDEVLVRYDTIIAENGEDNSLQFNLDYKNGTPLTILVFNRDNDAILKNAQIIYDKKKHTQMTFYVGNLKDQGIRNFRIEITNNKNRQKQILLFSK